jgi:hypothetical protein
VSYSTIKASLPESDPQPAATPFKTCRKCGQSLPVAAFRRDKSRPDGRHPYCRECKNAEDAARYRADPDAAYRRGRRYYLEHADQVRQRERERRALRAGQARFLAGLGVSWADAPEATESPRPAAPIPSPALVPDRRPSVNDLLTSERRCLMCSGTLPTRHHWYCSDKCRRAARRQGRTTSPDQRADHIERLIERLAEGISDNGTEHLPTLAAVSQAADYALRYAVTHLRDLGVSWADIGDALGISRQAAQQRWGKP